MLINRVIFLTRILLEKTVFENIITETQFNCDEYN